MELRYEAQRNKNIRQNPSAAKFRKHYSTKYTYFCCKLDWLKRKVKSIPGEINFAVFFVMWVVKYKIF